MNDTPPSSTTPEGSEPYPCPACGYPVPAPGELMQNVLICPACGHQCFIDVTPPGDEDDEQARAELERKLEEKERDLDGVRIRALSAERKAMLRLRTYWFAAAGACGVAIGQCGYWLYLGKPSTNASATPFTWMQKACLVVLIGWAVYGIRVFVRRARAIQAELDKPTLQDPTINPDFEPLGDGSQTWKKLEEMGGERAEGRGQRAEKESEPE